MDEEILVIGDLLLDVVVAPTGPIRTDGDIPAAVSLLPGGQGGNLAVRLARRGRSVRLVAALGDDTHGTMLRAACAADGVSLDARRAGRSGVVVILLEPDGRRSMLSDRAQGLAGRVIRGDEAAIVCSGYALLGTTGGDLARELAGRRAECRLVILGSAVASSKDAGELVARIHAASPDLVVCNRDEAADLLAIDEPDLARLAHGFGEHLETVAVVTDPRLGSASSRADVGIAGTVETAPPRDATGAGDAYAAALVDALLDSSWPPTSTALARAMRAGAELAAQVVGVVGAQTVVPLEQAVSARP
jgi:ribokinase